MKTGQYISQILRARGYRLTVVRRTILELLEKEPLPFSVSDIQAAFDRRHMYPNKTTLYREMKTFEQEGIVDVVHLGDRTARYELRRDNHHHHLICLQCGTVSDMEAERDCHVDKMDQVIERKSRFRVIRHSLEFFGLCVKCQAA